MEDETEVATLKAHARCCEIVDRISEYKVDPLTLFHVWMAVTRTIFRERVMDPRVLYDCLSDIARDELAGDCHGHA